MSRRRTSTTVHAATAMHEASSMLAAHRLDEALLDRIPMQGQWDATGYLWLSDLRPRLVEYVDGFIELPPMPSERHQTILGRLLRHLDDLAAACGGKALCAAMPMYTIAERYREPDLLFLRHADDPRRGKRCWTGADFVAEIISPDDPSRDLVVKRAEYAAAGVPEYWIIDPDHETVTVLALDGEHYTERGVYRPGDAAVAATLPGFTVDVAALLAED
ncbi:MAG: Uma2 family endonuclease [Ardenticatenales bacterium]